MIAPSGNRSSVSLYSAATEGVQRGVQQLNDAAARIAGGDIDVGNAVTQIEAGAAVKASLVSLRTADAMIGTLLDTVA